MKLQTHIPLSAKEPTIDYQSQLLLMGSCFTENIGTKLSYDQFRNLQNPFGVIFNPISLERLVLRAIREDVFTEKDVFEYGGLWHCFEVHSSLSALTQEKILGQLNLQLQVLRKSLLEASHLIFTLGTAWVYRHKETDLVVANCHKVPQLQFSKALLSIESIQNSLRQMVSAIFDGNPKATMIITVSPVRHLKDGFVGNTQSKAQLIAALHPLVSSRKQVHYFPSYELLLDELRDYRFYAEDLLHPNSLAIDYLWEKFQSVWVDPETEPLRKEVDGIQKALCHRPLQTSSKEFQEFTTTLQNRIANLKTRMPWANF
ncbi:MAG TPA: GSCFA domain-containing protein [Flavobacteriaceae bacterium]|nr:GSCFA domain-containing protein [Flavobacteriaceae bacterium]MCB9213012.1 GSCFA domain-containing protein [Alteromonas sp.]HPF10917.1 GSCFA domain-containing protein [Flavobacteriaceae bacterium]HQU20341.1 GSCFA domain-containing protein [Flavobacteriaceae bacterium]HQU64233.1 GSCFA domain-containing protein [Flavobacteriaceae bacterium]